LYPVTDYHAQNVQIRFSDVESWAGTILDTKPASFNLGLGLIVFYFIKSRLYQCLVRCHWQTFKCFLLSSHWTILWLLPTHAVPRA